MHLKAHHRVEGRDGVVEAEQRLTRGRHAAPPSHELGDLVEQRPTPALLKRGLEHSTDAVHLLVALHRGHQLDADRQVVVPETGRKAHRRSAVEARRQGREVGLVHRDRVVGSLADREGDGRRRRRDQDVDLRVRRLEVAPDQRAHLLRLSVVGVVVAGRQRVGAEHDAPLDLGAEPCGPRHGHHLLDAVLAVVAGTQAVAHAVEARQVARALARRDQVVRRQRVLERRARHLDDLGAERRQQLDGLVEPGLHSRLVALALQLRTRRRPSDPRRHRAHPAQPRRPGAPARRSTSRPAGRGRR